VRQTMSEEGLELPDGWIYINRAEVFQRFRFSLISVNIIEINERFTCNPM